MNDWKQELRKNIKNENIDKLNTWYFAIGLQDVDNLKPSFYLIENIKKHIEGTLTIEDLEKNIDDYYNKTNETIHKEADKVSINIVKLMSDNSFSFNPTELLNIHKKLFEGIYNHAGNIRTYNFTKKEWVLNDDTVTYASYETIMPSLEYDFNREKDFIYKGLSLGETIKHLSIFTANIWQIHPFCEGNTRTTAVFIIKYLKNFGFNINQEYFASNSWYFRNALVRANYKNFEKNIFEDTSYLEKFFYNLLTDSSYELKNRYAHIDYKEKSKTESITYSLEEQAIINIIKKDKNINQEEISKLIGKSLRTTKSIMMKMQEKGLIARMNGKRNGEWTIL